MSGTRFILKEWHEMLRLTIIKSKDIIVKHFCLCSILLMLFALASCDKYTAPSPVDGTWRMVRIENNSGEQIPIPKGAVPYWDFANVIYAVGYQREGAVSVSRMGYGNLYVNRDQMTLKANEGTPHFFPIPSTDKLAEVHFKYSVWNGKLRLDADNYSIFLEKK